MPSSSVSCGAGRSRGADCGVPSATFVGVTVEVFDVLVRAGIMPQPKAIPGADAVWDVDALDLFFTALPEVRTAHQGRSPSQ